MADYTDLDPTLLRASVSDGTNLKPSLTTSGYSGGTPAAATDLKRSICYADGTLKQSIADAVGVKASWLISGSARPPASAAVSNLFTVADEKADTTNGGTFTSGAWQTRDITVELYDPDGIITLSANTFTLGEGTYVASIRSCGRHTDSHQCRLYDVTGATELVLGLNADSNSGVGTPHNTYSSGRGIFTLTTTSTIRLEARAETTQATNGFGAVISDAANVVEKYSLVQIMQVA